MKFGAFVAVTYTKWSDNPKSQRLGQFFFNELHAIKPDLANAIRGTVNDPFYIENADDGRLEAFLSKVESLWYEAE
jgi:hypothetical protein